ncbi:MAG: V-type ATP synthase subunit A, partial [Clostridia bacterium]
MPKEITSINGPVIIATGEDDFAMHEMVLVGKERLMGEVINLEKENAIIQVYEETSGLKIGEQVIGKQEPLSVWLGPGLIGNIFDGIQRPLPVLKHIQGDFMQRGSNIPALDAEKKWIFLPKVKQGDKVQRGTLIGEVQETKSIIHKILYPYKEKGIVKEIQKEGEYTITDTIASIQTEQEESKKITMLQKWPVRKPRPYQTREAIHTPLITGQRVIDSIFPIAKGGTAAIPGGFGTGKTMLQHQIAKWSDADIIIYLGCGERGNEMTEVLEDFP